MKTNIALKKYQARLKSNQNTALLAWQALAGVWKGKRVPDAANWQKKIRREWERKIAE